MDNNKIQLAALGVLALASALTLTLATTRSAMAAPAAPNAPAQPKIVFSHYMHQESAGVTPFITGDKRTGPDGDNEFDKPSGPNGILANHLPESIINMRQPLAAARHDIKWAKGTGVNTFGLLLGADHLPNSYFSDVIHAMYQAAVEDGEFKISPDVWENVWDKDDPVKGTARLQRLGDAFALLRDKYDGAWRRYKGRRLVTLMLTGTAKENQEKLIAFEQAAPLLFDKIGGRSAVYLVLYGPCANQKQAPSWFAAADAFTTWNSLSYGTNNKIIEEDAACARAAGKEYWYPAEPSFAQARESIPEPRIRERLGMAAFVEDWERAIAANSPAVVIATWNDLTEDSSLMPETNHGYAYYELNKFYAAWFQSGRAPQVSKEQLLLFHHPQIVDGVQLPPGRTQMAAWDWDRATPPTDYIGVVAMLKAPAKVTLRLRELVIEKEFPAGVTSWFIYHPQAKTGGRGYDAYGMPWLVEQPVYPKERPGFVISLLDKPLFDTDVYLSAARGGKSLGTFRSHQPIVSAAARGNLTTIGNAFVLQ